MKILGIDTSTADSSIAVMDDDRILGQFTVNQKRTHSETLVPMIKDLLKYLGLSINDIDLFAVGSGPGSFTGIRIGMTIAKTLAQVTKKDIIGVSTLEAIAIHARAKYIMPVIDARGGRIYYAIFNEDMERLSEDTLAFAEDLSPILDKYDDIFVLGDYTEENKEQLKSSNVNFANIINNNQIARGICYIARERYEENKIDNFSTLKANYVRKSQAERDLKWFPLGLWLKMILIKF